VDAGDRYSEFPQTGSGLKSFARRDLGLSYRGACDRITKAPATLGGNFLGGIHR